MKRYKNFLINALGLVLLMGAAETVHAGITHYNETKVQKIEVHQLYRPSAFGVTSIYGAVEKGIRFSIEGDSTGLVGFDVYVYGEVLEGRSRIIEGETGRYVLDIDSLGLKNSEYAIQIKALGDGLIALDSQLSEVVTLYVDENEISLITEQSRQAVEVIENDDEENANFVGEEEATEEGNIEEVMPEIKGNNEDKAGNNGNV